MLMFLQSRVSRLVPPVSLGAGILVSLIYFLSRNDVLLVLAVLLELIALSFYFLVSRRTEKGSNECEELKKPLSVFSSAIAEFASGDMTARVPLVPHVKPEGESAASLVNNVISEFNSLTAVPAKRLCFSGNNSYEEGLVAGSEISRLLKGRGSLVIMFPGYNQANHALRVKGCINYLREHSPGINIVGTYVTGANRDFAVEETVKLLHDHPAADLVYITDGFTPPAVADVIVKSGKKHTLIIHDLIEENLPLLKKGIVRVILDQNAYGETYNSIVHMYNHIVSGWKPISRKLYLKPQVVTLDNLSQYWDERNNVRKQAPEEKQMLADPVAAPSHKKLNFALIMPSLGGFWDILIQGAKAAVASLEDRGVSLEVIDVFTDWSEFGSLKVHTPVIERLMREKFDGVALTAFDPNVIQAINRGVAGGLVITTFNTEPLIFREMIMNIAENVEDLAGHSQELAAAAEESARANRQISKSVELISEGVNKQKQRITESDGMMNQLTQSLSEVSGAVTRYSRTVQDMNSESERGGVIIAKTRDSAIALKRDITDLADALSDMNVRLTKINSIVETIEEFTTSTNVLAINASIQAARAGEAGKGFAVVAGQVRALAEQSSRATDSIRSLINDSVKGMTALARSSKASLSLVDDNLAKADEADQSFKSISRFLDSGSGEVSRITDEVSGIAGASKTVQAAMEEVNRVNGTISQNMAEISSSIGELSVQSQDLSNTASRLLDMARSQDQLFAQFEFEEKK